MGILREINRYVRNLDYETILKSYNRPHCKYIDCRKHNFSLCLNSHVHTFNAFLVLNLVVNGCIKSNETNALNTSFTCKKNAMKPLL